MCIETAIAIAGSQIFQAAAASTILSGVATGVGMYQQNKVAEYNAKLAEQQAEEAKKAGLRQETAHRQKVTQILASQRAQMAGSGVMVGAGSFGDVLERTQVLGEQDALAERYNAYNRAFGYTAQAAASRAQRQNVAIGSGMTLLTDAAGYGYDYYRIR